MTKIGSLLVFFLVHFTFAQTSSYKTMIDTTLQKTLPFISVEELKKNYASYIILDTREEKEFQTSHLKNAKYVGYKTFNLKKISKELSKKTPIVVYCSIGYRSEKIGEKLHKKGYTVYNLYGGIFNWKNNNNTVIDSSGNVTENIHCFNKKWSKWLEKGVKVYEKPIK